MAVDAKLVANLKQVKSTPMSFVFVAKGNEGMLLLDKKKISNKDADEAKKSCGGGQIIRGRCRCNEGMLIFEVGKEVSPTLPALTKKIIKNDGGMTFDVEYRVAADLATEEGGGEAPAPGAAPTAAAPGAAPAPEAAAAPAPVPPAAPPAPAPSAAAGAEVMKRLNAMAADIKTALTGPNKARVQTLFVAVNGQIKAKDFAAAGASLDELGSLLASAASAAPAAPAASAAAPAAPAAAPLPPTAPSAPAADDAALAAEWERRVVELEPKILAAQKSRGGEAKWMSMFMNAQDLGSDGQYAKSMTILDKLEGLLNAPPKTVSAELAAALQTWTTARADAVKQLQNEITQIAAQSKKAASEAQQPDGRFDVLAAAAELELRAVAQRLAGKVETKAEAEEMKKYLDDDEVVADVCLEAFDFRKPLTDTLDAIMDRLPA